MRNDGCRDTALLLLTAVATVAALAGLTYGLVQAGVPLEKAIKVAIGIFTVLQVIALIRMQK